MGKLSGFYITVQTVVKGERKASRAINRRFTQMDTEGNALSAWRKATH